MVLTVNGKAELIVQDAKSYQKLLELIDRAEAIEGIRRDLESMKRGAGRPAAEVFEVMDSLARSGAAVLMVSSEMPELLQVADRILVMRQGRLTGELPKGTTQQEIMRRATLALQSEENAT